MLEELTKQFGSKEALVDALRKQGMPRQIVGQLGGEVVEICKDLCMVKVVEAAIEESGDFLVKLQLSLKVSATGHAVGKEEESVGWCNIYGKSWVRLGAADLLESEQIALSRLAEFCSENPNETEGRPKVWMSGDEGLVQFKLVKASKNEVKHPLAFVSPYWEGLTIEGAGRGLVEEMASKSAVRKVAVPKFLEAVFAEEEEVEVAY